MSQIEIISQSELTVSISTRDRYDYLAHAVQSIINQTYKIHELIIFDDSQNKIDLRTYPFFLCLLQTLSIKNIKWEVRVGQQSQVKNHIEALNLCKTPFLYRLDDDNVLEPRVLENLYKIIKSDNKIGAVAPVVLHPDCVFPPEVTSDKIEDVLFKYAIQFSEFAGIRETQHLYSTFLIRVGPAKGCYPTNLSQINHREESWFSHTLYRKGYKLLVSGQDFVWHYRAPQGGIRSFKNGEFWESDDKKFREKLKEWGIVVNHYMLVGCEGGIGDNFIIRGLLPEIKKRNLNKKIIYATVYPDCLWDEKNIDEAISIHAAKILFGDLERFNPYMIGCKFEGAFSIFDCAKKCYNVE